MEQQTTDKLHTLHIRLQITVFILIVIIGGMVNLVKYLDFKINNRIDYNEWTLDLGSHVESDLASAAFQKMQYVNLNGAARSLFGQQYMNRVQKLDNGRLTFLQGMTSNEEIATYADGVARFSSHLAERGIPLLYFMPPAPVGRYEPYLPLDVEDHSNYNADRMTQMLRSHGVHVLDMREEMYADGIDHYDMMYATDHHWNTHAGFYAYQKITEWMQSVMPVTLDPKVGDPDSYTIVNYPDWHLGTFGQRTGIYFGGIDDFDLYMPSFDTMLTNHKTGVTGSITEVFYDLSILENRDYESRYTYDYVLGADDVNSRIFSNELSVNDTRLLIIGDSFFKAVCPFLIMGFQHVHFVTATEAATVTPTFLDEGQYDAVIILYDVAKLSPGSGFFYLGY